MIDQSLVQSGFDTEVLLGSRYLKYFLLNAVETGSFPLQISINDPAVEISIHPPEDYQRLYEPNSNAEPLPTPVAEGAFETEILFDQESGADLRVRTIVDVLHVDSGRSITEKYVDLDIMLALETEETRSGTVQNAKLRLEVVALELDPMLAIILLFAGIQPEDLLPTIKEYVDRTMDMGIVGADQNVQSVAMRKLESTGGHPAALGVYLNMHLRTGPAPGEFLGERGNLDAALNFLPPNEDMAFGMPGALYEKLSDDAKSRQAEEKENSPGDYHYPIRKDPLDRESDKIGKIKNITVRSKSGNRLFVDVHGEFFVDIFDTWDIIPDPDFHFTFTITPNINDGLLDWDVESDLDVDLFGELLIAFVFSALFFGFGATGVLALIILAVQELIVEPIAKSEVGDRADEAFDANFLDAIPHRITVERRRWDPFYYTQHQVVALIDDLVQINDDGIAFSGMAVLDKEPEPVGHVVIRDEDRSLEDELAGLWYRVDDFNPAARDSHFEMLATDRREYAPVENDVESDLYRLTLSQVHDRLVTRRVRDSIGYVPKRVFIRDGQIRLLLCISETELNEVTSNLIFEFRDTTRSQILDEQGDDLRQQVTEQLENLLGQPPTDELVQKALDELVDSLVAEAEAVFREEELPQQLETALDEVLRFDLDSPEFYALEDDKVLFIAGFERIRMVRNGKESFYYRDRPDGNRSDNLLSLPKYTPEPA